MTRAGAIRCVMATVVLGLLGPGGAADALAAAEGPWTPAIQQVDGALGRKEYVAALRAANDAYALAQAAPRWEGLVAVGDAYRRIGETTGLRQSFDTKAREAYQKALFRARQHASVEGVLRAAEGYAALGDAAMVAHGIRVAESLAGSNAEAQAEVKLFRTRLGAPELTAGAVRR